MALALSGNAVLHRVAATQDARLQTARSYNLPRQLADKALTDAKTALAATEKEASDECRSGRGKACKALEQREAEARQRVEDARTKLAGLGAQRTEDPGAASLAAIVPWLTPEQIQQAMPALLPLWLELAAPVLLSLGLSPPRREAPAKQTRAKRPKKRRRATRKPAAAKKATTGTVLPFTKKA